MSEHSLAHAALDMQTSHSNVKRIVEVLEKELGVPLFQKVGRGVYEPTDNALMLSQEMSRFLGEVDRFEERIKACGQSGKSLRVGAEAWFFETDYFVRFFRQLRKNQAYKAAFVEVSAGEEKHALESGHCDILVGGHVPSGRRLQVCELPPTRWWVARREGDAGEGLILGESWGLHFPTSRDRGRDFIRRLERAHGGSGRLISTSDFRSWAETSSSQKYNAVVAVAPAANLNHAPVEWHPLPMECDFPVSAVFLSQHPYGCLKQVIHGAAYEMKRSMAL